MTKTETYVSNQTDRILDAIEAAQNAIKAGQDGTAEIEALVEAIRLPAELNDDWTEGYDDADHQEVRDYVAKTLRDMADYKAGAVYDVLGNLLCGFTCSDCLCVPFDAEKFVGPNPWDGVDVPCYCSGFHCERCPYCVGIRG